MMLIHEVEWLDAGRLAFYLIVQQEFGKYDVTGRSSVFYMPVVFLHVLLGFSNIGMVLLSEPSLPLNACDL